ncbi:FumA C-terminus/TtdB family hydratase beta subunit [Candidatus Latescibacterota bacterium]
MENEVIKISTPLERDLLKELHAGDRVALSGEILVFRDQVHRFLCEMIENGEPLPFDITDAAVYYCGPTPARHGMPVGSAGPTTSSRMDAFTGPLLEKGLAITIGKGNRSKEVAKLLVKYNAVYMLAIGGTGALLAKHIMSAQVIAFPELGPEAARIFTMQDMPLIVGIDTYGQSAFKE